MTSIIHMNRAAKVAPRAIVLTVGLIVALITFVANYNWIISHFYFYGAYLYDSGTFADLIWHNDFNPMVPQAAGGQIANAVHFTPLYNIANGLSYLLPFGFVEYYAVFQGLLYTSLALVMFGFLTSSLIQRTAINVLLAGALAILFAFNGYALISIAYPHIEILWTAMAFGFFWMLLRKSTIAASAFFIGALIVREDGGFQLFSFLFIMTAWNFFRGIRLSDQRQTITFAALAFAYSVVAILCQKFIFHGGGLFAYEFMGVPPYAHLTPGYVFWNAWRFAHQSPWVPITALVAAIFAILDRQPRYLLGYVATLPYLFMYFLSPPNNELSLYRPFPILLAAVWPALEFAHQNKFQMGSRTWIWCCTLIGAVSIASLFALTINLPLMAIAKGFNFYQPSYQSFHALESFLDNPQLNKDYGTVALDESVIALRPRFIENRNKVSIAPEHVDLFVYWRDNFEEAENNSLLLDQSFEYGYQLKNTNVLVAGRTDMSRDPYLGKVLVPDRRANMSFPAAFKLANGAREENRQIILPALDDRKILVFGPYVNLKPGAYLAKFDIAPLDGDHATEILLDGVSQSAQLTLFNKTVILPGGNRDSISVVIPFTVANKETGEAAEFRVWAKGSRAMLKNISVRRGPH